MEVAPRTRIFGAVPNVPETFCTETPATRPSREREMSAIPFSFASSASTLTEDPEKMRRSTEVIPVTTACSSTSASHRGHTGDDRLFQHLGVRLQGDADIVPGGNGRVAVAHEGDHEILRALRYLVEDKVTVQVCEGADLGLSFHRHERADDRFSVFRGDDRAPECPCLRRSSGHSKKEGTDTEQIG